jgi:polysaccharide pyruvyl transferase WcaK-like protein
MSKKKILFMANCTTKNYGAASLVISTIEALNAIDSEIVYFKESLSKDLDTKRLTGIFGKDKILVFGFNGGRGYDGGKIPIMFAKPLLLLHSIKYLKEADLVLDQPGDVSNDIGFFSQMARLIFTQIFNKRAVIFACSLGPFNYGITRRLAKYFYRRAPLLIVREPVTKDYLLKLGIKNIVLTADIAFIMKERPNKKLEAIGKRLNPFIGISVNSFYVECIPGYKQAVVKIINHINNKIGVNVLIIPHGDDDKVASEEIWGLVKNPKTHILKGDYLPQEIRTIITQSEFFIGSRIHACISALSFGVPTIVFVPERDHRGIGTMKLFNMEDFAIPISSGSKAVISLLEKNYKNRSRLKLNILENLKGVKRAAYQNIFLIKDLLKES